MDEGRAMAHSMVASCAAVAFAAAGFPATALFLLGGAAALAAELVIHTISDAHHEGRLGAPETEVAL